MIMYIHKFSLLLGESLLFLPYHEEWFIQDLSSSKEYCIFRILDWGLSGSFWDHVTEISIRQMNFQYIFSHLWKVKIFSGNIHYLYIWYWQCTTITSEWPRGSPEDVPLSWLPNSPLYMSPWNKEVIWNGHGYKQSHWVRLTVTVCILFCSWWECAWVHSRGKSRRGDSMTDGWLNLVLSKRF